PPGGGLEARLEAVGAPTASRRDSNPLQPKPNRSSGEWSGSGPFGHSPLTTCQLPPEARMGLIDRLKNKAGEAASGLANAAVAKLKETIHEVHAFAPHFRDVGYRLEQLDVELSLSPRIVLHLDRDF